MCNTRLRSMLLVDAYAGNVIHQIKEVSTYNTCTRYCQWSVDSLQRSRCLSVVLYSTVLMERDGVVCSRSSSVEINFCMWSHFETQIRLFGHSIWKNRTEKWYQLFWYTIFPLNMAPGATCKTNFWEGAIKQNLKMSNLVSKLVHLVRKIGEFSRKEQHSVC